MNEGPILYWKILPHRVISYEREGILVSYTWEIAAACARSVGECWHKDKNSRRWGGSGCITGHNEILPTQLRIMCQINEPSKDQSTIFADTETVEQKDCKSERCTKMSRLQKRCDGAAETTRSLSVSVLVGAVARPPNDMKIDPNGHGLMKCIINL